MTERVMIDANGRKYITTEPWATGNYRCPKCCLMSKECKCFTYKGVHRCDICNGTFEFGEHYYSDSPASFVHVKCRFPKEQ